jgi:hypothetical protein
MKGCLIDPENLKPGDKVFHIILGLMDFAYIQHGLEKTIRCIHRSSNAEYQFRLDGKVYEADKYPSIYAEDPFKFVVKFLKEKNSLEGIEAELPTRFDTSFTPSKKTLKKNTFYLRTSFYKVVENPEDYIVYCKSFNDEHIVGGIFQRNYSNNNYNMSTECLHRNSDVKPLDLEGIRKYVEKCLEISGIRFGIRVKKLLGTNIGSSNSFDNHIVGNEKLSIHILKESVSAYIGTMLVFHTDYGFVTPL